MPEGSHSALHQGPMGEGKISVVIFSMTHALVIAAYELTSLITWSFNKFGYSQWYIRLPRTVH